MPLNHPQAVIGLASRKSLFRCCRARQVSGIMQVILHAPILSAQTVCSSAIQQTTLSRDRVVAALDNRGFRGAPNPNGPIPVGWFFFYTDAQPNLCICLLGANDLSKRTLT